MTVKYETRRSFLKSIGVKGINYIKENDIPNVLRNIPITKQQVSTEVITGVMKNNNLGLVVIRTLAEQCRTILSEQSVSHKKSIEAYSATIDAYRIQLENNDLSNDDRKKLNSDIYDLTLKIAEKDTEHKKYVKDLVKAGAGIAAAAGLLAFIFRKKF